MYVFLKAGSLYHVFLGNWRPASSKVPFDILEDLVDNRCTTRDNETGAVEDFVYVKLEREKKKADGQEQARRFIQSDPLPSRLILPSSPYKCYRVFLSVVAF